MYAQTINPKYPLIYKVIEILGGYISLLINGTVTDFPLLEISRFCNENGTNYYKKL